MRAAILGSSGGRALMAAVHCLREAGQHSELFVVSDRDCGMSRWAAGEGFESLRVPFVNTRQLSEEVLQALQDREHGDLLLFYTRLVSAPLIDACRVSNIHPSLLPAYPGMHAVEQALTAGARLLGATLHRVDAGLDTGPVVAQVACPLVPETTAVRANRLSYMQKVWLTLVWFDQLASATASRPRTTTSVVNGIGDLGVAVAVSSAHVANDDVQCAYQEWARALEGDAVSAMPIQGGVPPHATEVPA